MNPSFKSLITHEVSENSGKLTNTQRRMKKVITFLKNIKKKDKLNDIDKEMINEFIREEDKYDSRHKKHINKNGDEKFREAAYQYKATRNEIKNAIDVNGLALSKIRREIMMIKQMCSEVEKVMKLYNYERKSLRNVGNNRYFEDEIIKAKADLNDALGKTAKSVLQAKSIAVKEIINKEKSLNSIKIIENEKMNKIEVKKKKNNVHDRHVIFYDKETREQIFAGIYFGLRTIGIPTHCVSKLSSTIGVLKKEPIKIIRKLKTIHLYSCDSLCLYEISMSFMGRARLNNNDVDKLVLSKEFEGNEINIISDKIKITDHVMIGVRTKDGQIKNKWCYRQTEKFDNANFVLSEKCLGKLGDSGSMMLNKDNEIVGIYLYEGGGIILSDKMIKDINRNVV
jgi:hypothetical protein